MTTERHAYGSQRPTLLPPHVGTLTPVCGCGQDLDLVTGLSCPRCGTSLVGHAA